MIHEIHYIDDVKVIGDHSLQLTFEDGAVKVIDLTGFWEGELFKPLRDPEFFSQVRLNEECHVIEWPNGADFDPETLYHWDAKEMLALANEWKQAEFAEVYSPKPSWATKSNPAAHHQRRMQRMLGIWMCRGI